jgi:hypothetical protein
LVTVHGDEWAGACKFKHEILTSLTGLNSMDNSNTTDQFPFQNIEKTISSVLNFIFMFFKTNLLIFINPPNIQAFIFRGKLIPPRTFLFICFCLAYLSMPSFFLNINKFNSSIIEYQEITLTTVVLGVIPAFVVSLVTGAVIGKYSPAVNPAQQEFIRLHYYYVAANGLFVFALLSMLERLTISMQFMKNIFLMGSLFYPMLYSSGIMYVSYLRLFPSKKMTGFLGIRDIDTSAINRFIFGVAMALMAFLFNLFLFSHPLFTKTNKIFVSSPDSTAFQIQLNDQKEEIVVLRIMLIHHRTAPIIISGRFPVTSSEDKYNSKTGCIFSKLHQGENDDLTIVPPNEPVVITVTAKRSAPNCDNLPTNTLGFWVKIETWENGDFYNYGWIEGSNYFHPTDTDILLIRPHDMIP